MNIALDDIRSKAPEGATHYITDGGEIWYIKEDRNKDVWLWFSSKWIKSMPNLMLGNEEPL